MAKILKKYEFGGKGNYIYVEVDEFDFDEFKCLLKDTVPVLAEYVSMVVPIEVVSLLLAIKEFQNCPEIDQESGVAIRIASDLCDAENFCSRYVICD